MYLSIFQMSFLPQYYIFETLMICVSTCLLYSLWKKEKERRSLPPGPPGK